MKDFLNYVADNGLELFTWGDVNMDSAFLSFQRNIGISGIIYDRYTTIFFDKNNSVALKDVRSSLRGCRKPWGEGSGSSFY